MVVELDGLPPSANQYLSNSQSYHRYSKTKRDWERRVRTAVAGRVPPEPIKACEIEIRYTFPDRRRRDPDNYAGKMILDPLVTFGVLADDSFGVIRRLTITGEVVRGARRVRVTLTEV